MVHLQDYTFNPYQNNVGTDADGRAINVVDLLNTGLGESMGAAGDLVAIILFAVLEEYYISLQ